MDMRILVTGSTGHLGEALVRVLARDGYEVTGLDIAESGHTDFVGSITDRSFVRRCMNGIDAVIHTAGLHKPHLHACSRQEFVDSNVLGTLNLLEEAVNAGVRRFIYTSTTSTFGRALTPPAGHPSAWIDEAVTPIPKNVYGVTKLAAEDLCQLVHRESNLACLILRTSRFFCEEDDRAEIRDAFADENVKANELLYRRVDLDDVVSAHVAGLERACAIGFGRYIISATTPFRREDLAQLAVEAPAVVRRIFPDYQSVYGPRGWSMFSKIDRVYVNDRARRELGWWPRYDFRWALDRLAADQDPKSPLATSVGAKGYRGACRYPYRTGEPRFDHDALVVGGRRDETPAYTVLGEEGHDGVTMASGHGADFV